MMAVGAGAPGARRGADRRARLQPDHRAARRHHHGRRAPRLRRQLDPDRGRRRGDRARGPASAVAAPGGPRQRQVIYGNRNWSTSVFGATPDVPRRRATGRGRQGRLLHPGGDRRRRQGVLLGQTVAEQALRRRRPARPDGPRQARALHGGRRAGAARGRACGPGPGRHDPDPAVRPRAAGCSANQANAARSRPSSIKVPRGRAA